MSSDDAFPKAGCRCTGCLPVWRARAHEARARAEMYHARHYPEIGRLFPTSEFRKALDRCSWDPELACREVRAVTDRIDRFLVHERLRASHRLNRPLVGSCFTEAWLEAFIRAYLGHDQPVEVATRLGKALEDTIADRVRQERSVVRQELEVQGVRAVERAKESVRSRQDEADQAEAVRRIPRFDELTAFEKGKAIAAAVARIRAERAPVPVTSQARGGAA